MTEPADPAARQRAEIGLAVRALLRLAPDVHAALARRLAVGTSDLLALDHLSSLPDSAGVVELGRRLGIRSASATVLVDRLVAAGHARRTAHPTDRRRTSVALTDRAREDVRAALRPLVTELRALTSTLDEQQVATVLGFLEDLAGVLERFADEET